jgi:hypothetical protein
MPVNAVQHGQSLTTIDTLVSGATTVNSGLTGLSVGTGSFVVTAASVTTVADAAVSAGTRILVSAANSAAGLLMRTNSYFVTTGSGSFTFTVSATGAGAPAGTELVNYIVLSES